MTNSDFHRSAESDDARRKERISMAREICMHRGENPDKIDRGGNADWEKYEPLAGAVIREAERLFKLRSAKATGQCACLRPGGDPLGTCEECNSPHIPDDAQGSPETDEVGLEDIITDLRREKLRLYDALKNMMGVYDTPLSRRRFPPDEFMQVALESGRDALAAQPPAAPVERAHNLATGERDNEETDPAYFHCSAATEVLDFLNSIEGAGYGGMASFEIARAHVQDMLGTTKSAQVPMSESKYGLLPCPFCGAPARTDLLPHVAGPGWVQCSECECDQIMSDTLDEAVERWNRRAVITSTEPQTVVGCGTPGCTDPACDYGKGPLRCQSCGAVVVGEPQTAPLPVEAIRAAVTLLARKITKLSWSRDECRRKGQDVYVANLTAQIDQLDGYYSALSALALSRPHGN